MNFDFLIIPVGVILLGVLLLAIALVGTWFGGGALMGSFALAGVIALGLGLLMALIPILRASSKCFYCLN
jgi:hypothetical protein